MFSYNQQACKGDLLEIIVHNHMPEETTSIHWHGLHQRESPYMDGVPFITQCPILPKARFKYAFLASTPGTHFWHSHSGSQRGDGMFGALIIRRPKIEDPHRGLYDHDLAEHVMTVMDWCHKIGTDTFLSHYHSGGSNKPDNILVNGKGRFRKANAGIHEVSKMPLAVFNVRKGERYRFRLINAGFLNCPIEMSIDNHTITVINSDGGDIEAEEATSLVSYAGERWDFTLHPRGDVKNYWIRYRGLLDCDARGKKAYQIAILHYEGAPDPSVEEPEGHVDYDNSYNPGMQINPLNAGPRSNETKVITELRSKEPLMEEDRSLQQSADITHYLAYDFYDLDHPNYHKKSLYGFNNVINATKRVRTPQINHISMKLPSFPLLSQREHIKRDTFCEPHKVQNCSNEYCECTHHIEVPNGAVVELILVDEGFAYDANHPFHLHGHPFRVVAMDRVNQTVTVSQIQALDRAGFIHRDLENAPLKDTVTVPDGGFTIIRFHATNPGYWLFHCHIEFHVEMGMAVVFKIGKDGDMPKVPKGFPKCGVDYLPPWNEEMGVLYNIYNSSYPDKPPTPQKSLLPALSTSDNPTLQPSTVATTTETVNSQLRRKETSSEASNNTFTESPKSFASEATTLRHLSSDQNKQTNSDQKEDTDKTESEDIKINDVSSILQLLQGNIIKTEYRYNQHESEPEPEGTTMYNLLDGSETNQLSFNSKSSKENVAPPQKTSLDELHFAFIPIRIRNPISMNTISRKINISDTENEISPTLLTVGKNYLKSNQIHNASSTTKCNLYLMIISLSFMKATILIHLRNIL